MPYLLLIAEPRGQRAERGEEAGREAYAQMLAFAERLQAQGVLRAVESLADDGRGVRVQVRDGRARRIDGPFTEAKEMIGGFFLLDVATLDEAVALAAQCPAAAWASVEVRETGPCYA